MTKQGRHEIYVSVLFRNNFRGEKMRKTLVLATAVIGLHCVAIAGLFLVQGCKTTKGPSSPSATPMPPLSAPAVAPATIEPAPMISEKESKAEGTIEYTVQKGDSLGLIAKKHNISRSELIELNKLADPNKIRVGQKLVIPKYAHAVVTHAAVKNTEAKPKEKTKDKGPTPSIAAGINEYVVQAGDSLSKIASKLNVKISELREVNKLVNDKLKAGQKLVIPDKKAQGAPEPALAPAAPETPVTPSKQELPVVTPGSAAAPAAPAPAKNVSSGITHTVLANDDLNSLAKLYVVTVDDIVAINQMGTNRAVQAGQKIIIPQP